MQYFALFISAFIICVLAVPVVQELAYIFGVLDVPGTERKIHAKPMPKMGGIAIYISFTIMVLAYIKFFHPSAAIIPVKFYEGIILGGLVLAVGGTLDDKFSLKPRYQIIFPVLACLILVASGIGVGITQISNPFGPPFSLNHGIFGVPLPAVLVFGFVMGMIYTTKFLDGMDGLAAGISLIAGLTLFFLSLTPRINQSITASLTIIFCGALAGFLIYNFNPASIFLGESGSTLAGFILGVLSVLLGGKIATAVLVMGIPIMDVAWVITRRIFYGASPFKADRKHLHFRLLDIGFSQRQTVAILYLIAAFFGAVAIFLQSLGKLVSLIVLITIMIFLAISTVVVYKRKHPQS